MVVKLQILLKLKSQREKLFAMYDRLLNNDILKLLYTSIRCRGIHLRPKRWDVTGCWRKFHNEVLHDLLSPQSILKGDKVKEDKMGEASDKYEVAQKCVQGFGGKT